MSFSLRRLFWFTTFIAIYAAVLLQLGIALTVVCLYLGFGATIAASSIFGGPRYGDNERLGWDVLFICFAAPALIFLLSSLFLHPHESEQILDILKSV